MNLHHGIRLKNLFRLCMQPLKKMKVLGSRASKKFDITPSSSYISVFFLTLIHSFKGLIPPKASFIFSAKSGNMVMEGSLKVNSLGYYKKL